MSNTLRLRVVPSIGLSPVGSWRGDWTANTDYKYLDFVTDSAVNDNVYAATGFFTSSSSVADDVSAGNLVLAIDITSITSNLASLIINKQTGTTYTLQISDNGQIVTINNASPITVTLPGTLAQGFDCLIQQEGAGQITVAPGAGATMQSPGSANKTSFRYSLVNVFVFANSGGAAADWRLSGDITV